MPRGVLFLIVLVLLAQTVFAFDFDVEITPDVKAIKTNENAEFTLKLTHDSKDTESFAVYSPDINWNIITDPYPYLTQGSHELKLIVNPLNVPSGVYRIPVFIKATSTDDLLKRQVGIELTSSEPEYSERLPAVKAKIDFPNKIDPRTPVKLVLNLENRNKRELSNVLIKVRSDLVNEDYKTSLAATEKKQLEFTISFQEKTRPRTDVLRTSVFLVEPEKTYRYDVEEKPYSIDQYGDVSVKEEVDDGWFTDVKVVKFTNTGNSRLPASYSQELGFFKGLFTTLTPEPNNNDKWEFELDVNEEKAIKVYTSYVSLAVFIILVLLSVTAYYVFRSPVVLVKKTQVLKSTEGGINKLKVLLFLKNRSSQKIKNVRVLDVIPNLADFVEQKYEGTLNPVTIKNLEKGTLLKWQMELLEPGEERIIYYNVRNKLSVLEGLTLPVAVAKFTVAGNVERSTKSNVVDVNL